MKHIKQFRYYGVDDERNFPSNSSDEMISTRALTDEDYFSSYAPIVKLGIQTLPSTKFYLNDLEKKYPIIVGYTGIYELDLIGVSEINSLQFDLKSIQRINQVEDAYLIIDIIYEKPEGDEV